jgi:hypothetical protein
VLVRLRLTIPDRPGALGAVASVIGTTGADVVQVEVLSSEAGQAVDDIYVSVPDAKRLARLLERLAEMRGVVVDGCQHPAPPVTGHAELELVARLVADPGRLMSTLVDGAPAAVGADWAQVLAYPDDAPAEIVAAGLGAPEALEPPAVPMRLATPVISAPDGGAYGGVAAVPLAPPFLLLLVREQGPAFHRSEVWRLAEIGRIVGHLLDATPDRLRFAGTGAG